MKDLKAYNSAYTNELGDSRMEDRLENAHQMGAPAHGGEIVPVDWFPPEENYWCGIYYFHGDYPYWQGYDG